jgi:RNA polymerase sigma-70 factor, ECF subfamily
VDYSTLSSGDLALACFETGNESAWAEFIRRFQPVIARVVTRVARQWSEPSPQLVDDLIQETYLKLYADRAKLAQSFVPTHKDAIYGYIKVITANLVHDHFKATHTQKRDVARTTPIDDQVPDQPPDNRPRAAAALDQTVLLGQIDSCLRAIAPGESGRRDRLLFWLYYRVGLAAREIADLSSIGLTTKGVESSLLRLSREIRQRLVAAQPPVAPPADAAKGNFSTESF